MGLPRLAFPLRRGPILRASSWGVPFPRRVPMKTVRSKIAVMMTLCALVAGAAFAVPASDATTTLKVKLALLEKLGVDSLHIDVDTTSSAVALNGTVEKRETLELADSVAKNVDGVASVKNNLRLEGRTKNPSTVDSAMKEAEAEVKDAILETKIR